MTEPEFPRFSDAEYSRRRRALAQMMEERGVDHLLIVTDQRSGNAPQWVTGWPGTVEALVTFRPGEPITLHVEWYNHVPLAKRKSGWRWAWTCAGASIAASSSWPICLRTAERSASGSSVRSATRSASASRSASRWWESTPTMSACGSSSRRKRSSGCASAPRSAMRAFSRCSRAPGPA